MTLAVRQTRIASTAQAAMGAQMQSLSILLPQPPEEPFGSLFQHQMFRLAEFSAGLTRATNWTVDFWSLGQSTNLAARLLQLKITEPLPADAPWKDQVLLENLAIGHGVLSSIRLTPLVEQKGDEFDPFQTMAMHLDVQFGQLIQTQIACLKQHPPKVATEDLDRILESRHQLFHAFWEELKEHLPEA